MILGVLFHLATLAHAHDPGLSAAALNMSENQLTAHLTFARRDIESLIPIDTDHDGIVSAVEFAIARPHLDMLVPGVMAISSASHPLEAQVTAVELDRSDALHVRLTFGRQAGTQLKVSVPIVTQLARGHRQYVSVRDAMGNLMVEYMLDADHSVFVLALAHEVATAGTAPSWRQFLLLGVEHIVTGYDHLCFLFGLLVVGGSLKSAGRIITSFTLAHSLTLALATCHIIRLPSSLVEPLIAVSILYVGLENLYRRDLQHRWRLTFAFGLIHGLGFASVLRDLGIGVGGSREAIIPLLAFNFGVELGQLAIALCALPVIWRAQQLPYTYPRFATICSVLVLFAGVYWLCERTVLP
jgi:hydrogenase/urease accessory protein HupE